MSAIRIAQLRADYDAVHAEAIKRITATASRNGVVHLDDLQRRENEIDRELRSLGSSLSAVSR
jgi:Ran GTPase-activating protein (RanGAP) involved in mRNA processing and transport